MKKHLLYLTFFLSLGLLLSCDKKDTDFRGLFDGKEIVYPGLTNKVKIKPGKFRAAILFNPSPDQNVTKYVVYWNNKQDSVVVPATTHNTQDTVKIIVPNLQEYVYSFTMYSYDANGNKSVPLAVNNVKVYGTIYENGLLNRGYNTVDPYEFNDIKKSVRLSFTPTDTIDGFNIATLIRYTNNANQVVEKSLRPDSTRITLPDFKLGTTIQYKSSYVPRPGALDTFYVKSFSDFLPIHVQCDKSLFKPLSLPNDVGLYESRTGLDKLWDGSVGPQSYPNIFHSNDSDVPPVITFDMGKAYNRLVRMEETGRDCCGNPLEFEVWGTADISNAATTLKSDNPGWKAEMIAKGWTLLTTAIRTDDGKNAKMFNFIENPPPVRYIRMRINKKLADKTFNMSELTFWNNP